MAHLCDPNTCVAKGDSGLETQLELCNRDLYLNNQIKSNKVFLNVCGVGGEAQCRCVFRDHLRGADFFPTSLGFLEWSSNNQAYTARAFTFSAISLAHIFFPFSRARTGIQYPDCVAPALHGAYTSSPGYSSVFGNANLFL